MRGLSKRTREREGKIGGVLGLVYNSAFVVPEGVSLLEFLGGKHAPFVVEGNVSSDFSATKFLRGKREGVDFKPSTLLLI